MKKTILLTALLICAIALGSALAEERTNMPLYNGVTYFEPGSASAQPESVIAKDEAGAIPANGITVFEAGQPKTAEKSYAAGGSARIREPEKKLSNGVTVF